MNVKIKSIKMGKNNKTISACFAPFLYTNVRDRDSESCVVDAYLRVEVAYNCRISS